MPSLEHQCLAKLLAESPQLVPILVRRVFGIDVPPGVVTYQAPETIRELHYPELTADGTVLIHDDEHRTREAFVVEVQLRPDEDKRYSWPMYVVGMRRRLRCPVTLIVLTTSRATAKWCAEPIEIGRNGMALQPLVIGPDDIPRSLDEEEAHRHPELAVLAVIAHGRRAGSERLGRVAFEACTALAQRGDKRATLLLELIFAFLGANALKQLESQMDLSTTPFAKRYFARGRQEGRKAGHQEGELAGQARALLSILRSRGLPPPDEVRDTIFECTDMAQLDTWLSRSATAKRLTDVFG